MRLGEIGVQVLDGTAITVPVNGIRLGIAGVMGGSGGFPGHPGNPDEGSAEYRARYRRGPADAARLRAALESLDSDLRIARLHFSPVVDTLVGEPPRSIRASAARSWPTRWTRAARTSRSTDTPTAAPSSAAPRAGWRSAMSRTR
ncbi:hypothetical protein ACFRAQ_20620 [Nocardia sp. NPDC056611]|uniref:hypothetical protein n=1 Tax=Nocardia sp. NPDC056611 TaxID=3345877 RepID=UPI00366B453E